MRVQRALKRLLDVLLSAVALCLLVFPFGLIALALKLDSRGPVFFRQERVGKDGHAFIPLKLRTMQHGSRRGVIDTVSENDPRFTRVGKFLRTWGLDELPQLWNVLKGDMSLVGPRPTLCYQVERYDDRQMRRLLVKPGLTGWALIQGRNAISWEERIEHDLWYVDNWTLWVDLKVLFRTLVVVLKREGLYGPAGINEMFGVEPERREDA